MVTPDNPKKSLMRCPAFGGSLHAFQHVREAIDRTVRTEDERVLQEVAEKGEALALSPTGEVLGVWTRPATKPTFAGNRKSRRKQEAQWRRGDSQ